MAAYGWGTTSSVKDWLYAEGYRFNFFQAVRLLELLAPEQAGVGHSHDPLITAVQFQSTVSQAFPPSDIRAIVPGNRPGDSPTMEVNFMGLAGTHGPLPVPYTDVILERLFKKDAALKEFLDIFNHRLVSLAYRIRKTYRIGFEWKAPEDMHAAAVLFPLVGLGTPGLRNRLGIADWSLVAFGGLMANQVRSLAGLESVVRGYFSVPVTGQSFLGGWEPLEDSDFTRLGKAGANRELGRTTVLGKRIWDQQQRLNLTLGPLTYEQFETFLPIGWGYHPLRELTEWYAGRHRHIRYTLCLQPQANVPGCRLSATQTAGRLGWTAWLHHPKSQGATTTAPVTPRSRSPKVPEETEGPRVHLSRRSGHYAVHLMGHPLFKELPLREVAAISRHMTIRRFEKGAVVVRQGEPGETLFIMRQGKAQVIRKELDGKERHVGTLAPGECFGEFALLTGKPGTDTVVMLEDSTLYELRKDQLHDILQQFPRIRHIVSTYLRRKQHALSRVA
jgi:type VI secretion system protein ImpH